MINNHNNKNNNIICTLGIGSGASSDLVNNIAKVGNGISDMIVNESLLSSTVIKQLKFSISKVIDQPYLEFKNDYSTIKVNLISNNKLFENTYVTLYGIYDEDINNIINNCNISLRSNCNTINIPINYNEINQYNSYVDHKI